MPKPDFREAKNDFIDISRVAQELLMQGEAEDLITCRKNLFVYTDHCEHQANYHDTCNGFKKAFVRRNDRLIINQEK